MTVNLVDLLDADPWLRLAMRRSMLEHASGEWLDLIRHHIYGYRVDVSDARDSGSTCGERVGGPRDVRPAVRDAIEAARALQPAPRNRHERRRRAALRRRGETL
jgi:hypothetical protein